MVNIRSGAGTHYDAMKQVQDGSKIYVYEYSQDGQWALVCREGWQRGMGGWEGWMASKYVEVDSDN